MQIREYIKHKKSDYCILSEFLECNNEIENQQSKMICFLQNFHENREELTLFLNCISKILKNHYRTIDFLKKIDLIFSHLREDIKILFSSLDLLNTFGNNLIFLRFLFEKNIITIDKSVLTYLYRKKLYNSMKYIYYFYPILKKGISKKKIKRIESKFSKKFSYDFDTWLEKCRIGENETHICHLIRNDKIQEFVIYINQNNISLSSIIHQSIFETNPFLRKRKTTLIEYASFFGSIQIFQYLRLNHIELEPSLWLYAIHGRNPEIIRLLEENEVKPKDETYLECFYEAIKCHHNEIANYIHDNYLDESFIDQQCLKENFYDHCFHYYNYNFFPDEFNSDPIFLEFCSKYNYYELVTLIMKDKSFKINESYVHYDSEGNYFQTTFYNCSIILAANHNNLPIVYFLLSHNYGQDKKLNFYGLKKLRQISIPHFFTYIPKSSFFQCSSLTQVILPPSVTYIDDYAFYECSSLHHIKIPPSVTSIGDCAFSRCLSITKIKIPSSVTSIKEGAFSYCKSLIEIELQCPIKEIEANTFSFCKSLRSIQIPSSVTKINSCSFWNCFSLTKISIPSSVTSIGDHVFLSCSSLAEIQIPSSVTSIGCEAFAFCSSLLKISIPSSVTSISNEIFDNCSKLSSVTFLGYNSFGYCSSLTDKSIQSSVAIIGCSSLKQNSFQTEESSNKDFEYTNLSSITYIGHFSFSYCSSLTEISIPLPVISIGYSAFVDCWSLRSITIPTSVTSIDSLAFSGCVSLEEILFEEPCSITSFDSFVFNECKLLSSISIPHSVKSIEDYSFNQCKSLIGVTIPTSVERIGKNAFNDCISLQFVIIQSNAIKIDQDAFSNCISLKQIQAPFYIKLKIHLFSGRRRIYFLLLIFFLFICFLFFK